MLAHFVRVGCSRVAESRQRNYRVKEPTATTTNGSRQQAQNKGINERQVAPGKLGTCTEITCGQVVPGETRHSDARPQGVRSC